MKSKIVWNDIRKTKPNSYSEKDVFIVVKKTEIEKAFIQIAEPCGYGEKMYFETCGGWIYTIRDIKAWAEMPEVPEFGEGEAE